MNWLLKREIEEIVSKKKSVVIITHKQADLDAVASSIALKHFLVSIEGLSKNDITVVYPEGISKEVEESFKKCGIYHLFDYVNDVDEKLLRESSLIILDTASETQLPEKFISIINNKGEVLLIDHHYSNTLKKIVNNYYWDTEAASLSEIVAELYSEEDLHIDISTALVLGILADTGRFSRGSHRTFSVMGKLTKFNNYETVKKCLPVSREDRSIRIARLKALQRMAIEIYEEAIIVATYVSSFESEIADFLIRIGSDASIVISPKNNEFRVMLKFRDELKEELKERILRTVEKILASRSAGHRDFAVIVVKRKIGKNEAQKIISEIRRELHLQGP
ncbi:MAG: DHH family phosphoesterase [Fervidicoccaceae archaeon]